MKTKFPYLIVVLVFVLTAFSSKSYQQVVQPNAVPTAFQCPTCDYFKQQIDFTWQNANGNKCAAVYCTAKGMMMNGCASSCNLVNYVQTKYSNCTDVASYCAICPTYCN